MCTHAIIPDDILELILVRLDSTACLIRASSTCKRWRRLIAGVGFLRRFRSIHGPLITGTYHDSADFTRPAGFVPSPSSGIDGRYFSLDFLPSRRNSGSSVIWTLKDTRAGLVLLERQDSLAAGPYKQDLVICEPLSRRYEVIPLLFGITWNYYTEAFLLDGGGGSIGLSNFRVICICAGFAANSEHYEAGVFTSDSSSYGWRPIRIHGQSCFRCFHLMGHSNGKIYWWVDGGKAVAVDRATADLAAFVLRDGVEGFDDDHYQATVTTGRDGEARIAVGRRYGDYVKVFAARHVLAVAWGREWVLEKTIRLPAVAMPCPQWQDSCWRFRDPASAGTFERKGTVFIESEKLLLALDLDSETIEIETTTVNLGYPLELPWPPLLRACRQAGIDLGHHDR
ncbi:unnamed protein product [Urochloa decumbens]|uniref:F-box domain-containing protein n=1 Tax=Urochloa decumbens TaxID=240449 RepID=A0ABC8WBD7_9POAL